MATALLVTASLSWLIYRLAYLLFCAWVIHRPRDTSALHDVAEVIRALERGARRGDAGPDAPPSAGDWVRWSGLALTGAAVVGRRRTARPGGPVVASSDGWDPCPHRCRVDGHGEVVVRRFASGDDAVVRERKVLAGLSDLAPRLLAADPDGSQTGSPSIVTTLVPGVATLFPADPLEAGGQLGRALARVHAHPCPGTLPDLLTPPRPTPGTADALRSGWAQAQATPRVLSHRDFWTGNTLWVDEQLSGIVDWSGAGRGPRGQDLSWCRLDLVLLHGRAVADAPVTAYEHCAGVGVHDLPWWDPVRRRERGGPGRGLGAELPRPRPPRSRRPDAARPARRLARRAHRHMTLTIRPRRTGGVTSPGPSRPATRSDRLVSDP